MKKPLLSVLLVMALAFCFVSSAFAAMEDPAIIANGNVSLSSAYLVEGNVYSAEGNIAFGTGSFDACVHDGNAIVTDGHAVTFFNKYNMPDFRGEIITDDSVKFNFTPVPTPAIPEGIASVDSLTNKVITESFSISNLSLGGDYTIDTSASDIYIVADNFNFTWGTINVTGGNKAYIVVNNGLVCNGGTTINSNGNLSFVIKCASFMDYAVSYADFYITEPNLSITGGGTIYGNLYLNNPSFLISGDYSIYGTVYGPETAVSMSGDATVYGTVIAKSFSNPGKCNIIYDPYYYSVPTNSDDPDEGDDNNDEQVVTAKDPIALSNDYAYILGKNNMTMGADMPMLRGEASSVLYRLLKQNDALRGFVYSESAAPVFDDIDGRWDRSALEFTTYLGVYDESKDRIFPDAAIKRGEAFKLFAITLGMTDQTSLSYDDYANMLIDKGFVHGDQNGNINIDKNITRAEYCKIYNIIIGRDKMSLEDAEGNEITPATYGFTDFDESKWYYSIMLKATSAYTDGKVDLSKRAVRNVIDDYID